MRVKHAGTRAIFALNYEFEHDGEDPKQWPDDMQGTMPVFTYVPQADEKFLVDVGIDAGILGGLMVVFVLMTYMLFLRYDVR